MEQSEMPALGTAEAAVRSCVSLMAAVMGQREELLAYWLDLYFQVRSAYEREARHEEPAARTLVRIEELYPLLRDMFTRELKSALDGKTVVPLAGIPAEAPDEGIVKQAEPENAEDEAKPKQIGGWTIRKRRILDKLRRAREQGATYAGIVKASAGAFSEADLFAAMGAKKLPAKTWTQIEAALDGILFEPIVAQEGA